MARGVNKVILIGVCGKDPETRYLPSGGAVTNISIATSEQWKDMATGEKQERTEWHNITFFKRLAEIAGQYLSKGAKVYIEGKLQTDKWTDKNGQDRYTTKIIANEMEILSSKPRAVGDGVTDDTAAIQAAIYERDSAPQKDPDEFSDEVPF